LLDDVVGLLLDELAKELFGVRRFRCVVRRPDAARSAAMTPALSVISGARNATRRSRN
jgi:hypothetical protein